MNKIFCKTYDAVVAGGGIAGISAALASARRGLKTALIEKQNILGGLATSGLICIYFPLCDGCGNQVTFGIAEELLLKSLKYSPFDLPAPWNKDPDDTSRKKRYMCQFSPAAMILAADELLADADVDLWLDTSVCGVQMDSDKLTAIEVLNVSGHGIIHANKFIDATGDASLIRYAGGKLTAGCNRKSFWFLEACNERSSFDFHENIKLTSLPENNSRLTDETLSYSGKTVTDFTRSNWKSLREYYQNFYENGKSGRHQHFPVSLPAMPQFRTIARITGKETVSYSNVNSFNENSVGLCADWRYPGKVFETPFGALLPADIKGVITAGRIISSDEKAWEVFRVIPAAAMTGEAAGTAAALAEKLSVEMDNLEISLLQKELSGNNIRLHCREKNEYLK